MKYYLISYDLKSPGHNYSELYDAIKRLGEWKHPMESTWVVLTEDNTTAVMIRENLKKSLVAGDLVFVVNVSSAEYAGWLASSFWEWYRKV